VADWAGLAGLLDPQPNRDPQSVDLGVPVICVWFRNGYLPIDGWNRIGHALAAGIPCLPCVRLTADESRQVEV
jgi:hypothetical protein